MEGRRAEEKSKRASGKGFFGVAVVAVARGRVGERGKWIIHWASETEGGAGRGGRARRRSGDQSIGRFSPCFFVNSSAFFKNFLRSFEYSSARSALRGCSGWGSFTSAMSD